MPGLSAPLASNYYFERARPEGGKAVYLNGPHAATLPWNRGNAPKACCNHRALALTPESFLQIYGKLRVRRRPRLSWRVREKTRETLWRNRDSQCRGRDETKYRMLISPLDTAISLDF